MEDITNASDTTYVQIYAQIYFTHFLCDGFSHEFFAEIQKTSKISI